MNVLALDFATKTGWAHTCGLSGTWNLSVKPDESSGMRLIRLRSKLIEIKRDIGFELVVFERVIQQFTRKAGFDVAAELQGQVKVWCLENNVDHKGYFPADIKQHATGKRGANKLKMIEAAQKKWRRPFEDDNEVDALWLLDLAKKDLNLT